MVELTFFEIHLDGAEFAADAPFGSERTRDGDREDASAGEKESGDAGGPNPLSLLIGVGLLAVAIVVLRRIVGGSPEPIEA